ncbi:unnamed protein product [Rotaria sp. Silwood1]|nr:unnamed protein product [Rotaria sp. Silwood1]
MQLSTIDSSCCGPTETSHWVISKRLLSSAYPGAKNLDEHRLITRAIYDSGIEVFVNLMRPTDLTRFTPYEPEIRQYATQDGRPVEFLSFPIRDQFICRDDRKVLEFCSDLCKRITEDDQKILIHCWGGHGRTGTIISILIGMLFQFEADDALDYNDQLHKQRLRRKGRTASLASCQNQQVRNVLNMYKDQQTSSSVSSIEKQTFE